MPELPEVETVAKGLRRHAFLGVAIERVEVLWPKTVTFDTEWLYGQSICSISRWGKWLLFKLSSKKIMAVHLRMTGRFAFAPSKHDRFVMHFANNSTCPLSSLRRARKNR